jgi:ABC-type Fe3+/spermidine/putrescine transport system ATPase subunit
MKDGRVEQTGPPQAVYDHPTGRWVAEFLGAAEILPGTVAGDEVTCELGRFPAGGVAAGSVEVIVRPEHLLVTRDDDAGIAATVLDRAYYGHDQRLALELPSGRRIHSRLAGGALWHPGDRVHLRVDGPVTVLSADQAVSTPG